MPKILLTVMNIVCKINVSETFETFFLFKHEVFCQCFVELRDMGKFRKFLIDSSTSK